MNAALRGPSVREIIERLFAAPIVRHRTIRRVQMLVAGRADRSSSLLSLAALMASLTSVFLAPARTCAAVEADSAKKEVDGADAGKESAPQSRMAIRAVSADSGEPLADVEIEFHGTINNGLLRLNLTADENGRSEFAWPRGGKIQSLSMTARKSDHVPVYFVWSSETRPIELPEDVELIFEAGQEIGGVVLSDTGKPIAGARVQLRLPATWPKLDRTVFVQPSSQPTTKVAGIGTARRRTHHA